MTEDEVLAEMRAMPDGIESWRLMREDHATLLRENREWHRRALRIRGLASGYDSAADVVYVDRGRVMDILA